MKRQREVIARVVKMAKMKSPKAREGAVCPSEQEMGSTFEGEATVL